MRIPDVVRDIVGEDAVWSRDHEGQSDGVWKTSGSGGTFFVRYGDQALIEHDRLRWLGGRVPVPAVALYDDAAEDAWLVLEDVRAPSLPAAGMEPALAGRTAGELLRRLHSLPVRECPYDARIPELIERARLRVEAGLVNAADFDDDHAARTPGELWELLVASQPADEDLVVTHGDFSPANVLVRADGPPVLIDVAGLGVADRHRDLALAGRDLADELGAGAFEAFTTAYGLVPRFDPDRMYWYRLLDEFF